MKRLIRYFLTFAFALSILLTFMACRNDDNSSGNDTSGNDTSIPDGENHVCTTDPCEICGSEGLDYALGADGMSYAVIGIGDFKGTEIVIPGTYNGLPVTEIGTEAFWYCKGITSITIPDSITVFGEYFLPGYEYSELNYNEYDNACYLGNSSNPYLLLVKAKDSEITSCTIHPDTKAIYYYAFGGCLGLTEISVPEGVTHILAWAFSSCRNLGALDLPESLDYLGTHALYECVSLKYSVYNGVTYFGTEKSPYLALVSANAVDVEKFDVPNGTKFICENAFATCNAIVEVDLPDTIRNIGRYAFGECAKLTKINFPDGLRAIENGAFWGCPLTSVTIPDSVTLMGSDVFSGCSLLKSVELGNGIKTIYNGVFRSCKALESVTFPSYLVSIKVHAFMGCQSLDNVMLPDSVREIGSRAFYLCTSLKNVSMSNSIETFGDGGVFYGCPLEYNIYGNAKYFGNSDNPYIILAEATGTDITSCDINSGTRIILEGAFRGCAQLTSIEIPDSVVTISEGAFEGCTSLKTVTFGDSIETIYSYAFSGCESLESVTLPDSVIYIKTEAFYGCESLKSVTLGNNVKAIGDSAFSGSPYLTEIIVPKSVTTVGIYAFENCENLTIYCEATSKPEGWSDYWNVYIKDVVWGYNG